MAAPSLRIVRRPKGSLVASAGQALTAASAPVDDPNDIFKTAGLGGRRNDWQNEAWELLDLVGEFRFYVRWRASSCSRVRLVASEIDPDTGLPTGSIAEDNREGQRVMEIVRGVAGGPLGQAQLIKRSAEALSVPGEYWITILMRPEGERWFAVTREEIGRGTRANSVSITLPDGKKHEFDRSQGDGLFKVWNPHPRKASEPDSPARGVLEPMREIVRTTNKISNADLSRLISAGILFIPTEASLPSVDAPVSADKPGAPPAPEAPRQRAAQGLQQLIVQNAKVAAEEGPKSAAAVLPLVVSAPGDQLDKIKHLTFGDEVTKVALETRNDAIARLAMGLDMAPEQLLGIGKNSNHWSSHLLADQDVQVHVSPVMQTICQAIYDSVLTNVLEKENIDPAKYTLWYDTSDITADPDKTDEAKDANESGALKNAALLRHLGLPEDDGYDLTSLEGLQELARDKVAKAEPAMFVKVIRDVLPLLDPSVQAIDFPAPQALPPAESDGGSGEDERVDPGDEPDTEGDEPRSRVASIGGGDGVSMAVELMVTRALDLANKRRVKLNDHVQRARLRDIPSHEYHRYMPPVAGADVPKLIKGWDAGLDDIAERYGFDAEQVRAVVMRRARRELTTELVDGQVG